MHRTPLAMVALLHEPPSGPSDIVLVKGSLGTRMAPIVEAMRDTGHQCISAAESRERPLRDREEEACSTICSHR